MSWCCKFAFSVSDECKLAYCMSCKEGKVGNKAVGRGRSSRSISNDSSGGLVGTQVTSCKEGEYGKHTEADLKNLVEQEGPTDYLKETRKRKDETGWERIAKNC